MDRKHRLQEVLGDRDVEGVEGLREDEQEDVEQTAERNPDRTTRREAIEQELIELGRSEAGADTGD
jgi:hypothetical protein